MLHDLILIGIPPPALHYDICSKQALPIVEAKPWKYIDVNIRK